jgi:predicted acetyltransferase
LRINGGHIGLSIRPTERGKHYGTEALHLGILFLRLKGVKDILILCENNNIASANVIIKNGGELEREDIKNDGKLTQYYWIKS